MKRFVSLLSLIVTAGIAPSLTAQTVGQETRFDRQLRDRDDQPLKDFVESKENIDLKKKANNLEISGDVRTECRYLSEKGLTFYLDDHRSSSSSHHSGYRSSVGSYAFQGNPPAGHPKEHYRSLRGHDKVDSLGIPLSHYDLDIEFNLKFKYVYENAWAMAHFRFDNPAGCRGFNDCVGRVPVFDREGSRVLNILERNTCSSFKGSGLENLVFLRRAFIGYTVWADGKHRFDVEIGRRKLDDIFTSEIQFSNRFDGVLLKYSSAIGEVADFYWTLGGFVIDERVHHFGAATELGVLNVLDLGLDVRYSFIDWQLSDQNRCHLHDPLGTRYRNSQISFSYTIYPTILCYDEMPIEFYGGFLINHAAKKLHVHSISCAKDSFKRSHFSGKENLGWYGGIYLNDVKKKGDWAMDIEYVFVQAQAVSDYDVGSIGRGNILDMNFYDAVFIEPDDATGSSSSDYIHPYLGNANFAGWHFEFLYGITDNLSADFIAETSWAIQKKLGGAHRYSCLELEVIYAF